MKRRLCKDKTAELAVESSSREPRLYRVVLHHDDFTPMEFVLEMMESVFLWDRQRAAEIIQIAREQGRAACGIFTRDIAATKVQTIQDEAISNEHPLLCSMEVV